MNRFGGHDHNTRTGGCARAFVLMAAGLATLSAGCSRKGKQGKKKNPFERAASALERMGKQKEAASVRRECEGKKAGSCECIKTATVIALDRNLHAEALAMLGRAPSSCPVRNLRAEALARAWKLDEATKEAAVVLKASPSDKHALYARALVLYARGNMPEAELLARKVVGLGRVAAGQMLIGLMAFKRKDYQRAMQAFQAMLQVDPADEGAIYNIALIHHRQNRYRDAREGYLKALKLNPRFVDARHNLVVLTHSVGAMAEAKHHFKKFQQMVKKNDPRVAALRTLLASPPSRAMRRPPGPTGVKGRKGPVGPTPRPRPR